MECTWKDLGSEKKSPLGPNGVLLELKKEGEPLENISEGVIFSLPLKHLFLMDSTYLTV